MRLRNLPKSIARVISQVITSIRNAFAELRNVSWLTPKETVKFSLYVLGFMIISAVIVALLDLGFYNLLKAITNAN